jgi:1-acyl-sn-glycerol-3-phosphate acyltransferase
MSIRGKLGTGLAIYKTLAISVPTVLDAMLGRITRERCDVRLSSWAETVLRAAQVEVLVEGRERVPARPVIFMSNHGSHLDVPILYVACPGSLRMVAKAELFRVPIWGRAMKDAGFISVDRSGDRAQAREAMREAGETIRGGVSVWIAPEGTRSRDGRIGKLKRGGFRLAIETGTPIVPVFIDGARQILPAGSRFLGDGGTVRVRFGEMIEVAGRSTDELLAQVDEFLRGQAERGA